MTDMTNIFGCQDDDGDELTVRTSVDNPDSVLFDAESGYAIVTVRVYREQVNELHAALGRWRSENGITAQLATAPPTPSDHDFIRQVVHEEVARVLPLHLAPQAAECDGTACCQPHPVPEPLCGLIRPADAHAAARCTWCGHLWTEHAERTTRTRCGQCDAYNDTPAPHVCEPEPEHHGRLMSELPRRVRPRVGTDVCRCGDLIAVHGEWGCGAEGCRCLVMRVR